MTHLDLQHLLYMTEEQFYKDFPIKTYSEWDSEVSCTVKKNWELNY